MRHKRKALSGLDGKLETVSLEVMAECVRAAVHIRRSNKGRFGRVRVKCRDRVSYGYMLDSLAQR